PRSGDRPACAETVMQAVATDQAVKGSYTCFDDSMQAGLQTIGIDSDNSFATRVGQNGEYHFLHKTADGGYVYEYDRPEHAHDQVKGANGATAPHRVIGCASRPAPAPSCCGAAPARARVAAWSGRGPSTCSAATKRAPQPRPTCWCCAPRAPASGRTPSPRC